MSVVSSKEILLDAQKKGYAIGAFNAENMEMVMAIVAAAEETRTPVIIQTTPTTVKFAGCRMYSGMVHAIADQSSVPVVLHLDHGSSFEMAQDAVASGYSSVMIDGSKEPFENNIAVTKRVVDFASGKGIPVEAELGKVGGKEDEIEGDGGYTVPEEAEEFVDRTGVDSLAIAIGTAHGVYKKEPKLNVECLKQVRKLVSVPLVLHGASGLSEDAVKECIVNGICKVNFATELRIAYTEGIREFLANDQKVFDPKKYGAAGIAKVKELVIRKIRSLKP